MRSEAEAWAKGVLFWRRPLLACGGKPSRSPRTTYQKVWQHFRWKVVRAWTLAVRLKERTMGSWTFQLGNPGWSLAMHMCYLAMFVVSNSFCCETSNLLILWRTVQLSIKLTVSLSDHFYAVCVYIFILLYDMSYLMARIYLSSGHETYFYEIGLGVLPVLLLYSYMSVSFCQIVNYFK